MHNNVRRDLGASAFDFMRVVAPALKSKIGDGRIEPVELSAGESLKRDLDILAGTDAFQMQDDQGRMRAIASRIQWGNTIWQTYTIRVARKYEADGPWLGGFEWDKRVRAFLQPDAGWILPALTVQAYLTWPPRQGRLIEAAVVRTADLLRYALKNKCRQPRETHTDCNHENGKYHCALLDWYHWDTLAEAGVNVGRVGISQQPLSVGRPKETGLGECPGSL